MTSSRAADFGFESDDALETTFMNMCGMLECGYAPSGPNKGCACEAVSVPLSPNSSTIKLKLGGPGPRWWLEVCANVSEGCAGQWVVVDYGATVPIG